MRSQPVNLLGKAAPFQPLTSVKEDGRSAKEPATAERSPASAEPAVPAEQEMSGELGELRRIQSKVALWDAEERRADGRQLRLADGPPVRRSDQIHVMGLNLAGRYIAHTLAGCQTIPPVRYILHSRSLYGRWRDANKQLTLIRGNDIIVRRRVVGEYISEELEGTPGEAVIENLIVTVPAGQVLQALQTIRNRLDHRSTICLINDCLGVAEALIEAYFPDESRRPTFLLGHFTTALGHTDDLFSVSEVRPGRLYLSLFSPQGQQADGRFRIKRHPPLERTERATSFLRLLTAMPGLKATGHPMADFLRLKLPTVAFRTVVDPLAALFDCRYDHLLQNTYARQLMDRLVGEVSRVVSLLPECRDSPKFRQLAIASSLRDEVRRKLMLQRTADSRMRAQIGHGWDTDIDFLSGYFVRRGRELRAGVTALDSIMWAVKAKGVVMSKKLGAYIPFETTQPTHGEY
ncbi:e2d8521c-a2ff-4a23-b946-0686706d4507 [Thermothielavioides terrestris]|uniref:E2d8521c-a2ff-4a23-b946-0686706d4507 n=1 Tax=Thermothielavioides terrestris TaxID=2587410 RepID=A0A446BAS1_9PEZI|nr:e2d8521c-a2ff-4a23-b946-0686706d4507 [Thermothielavioides terrestris]